MFGSQILDIAIAMIMFYLFISLICSAIREGIEALTKARAMNFERGIRELLADPDGNTITKAMFDHPLLSGLFSGSYNPEDLQKSFIGLGGKILPNKNMGRWGRQNLPAYIPAANFAAALLDITARGAVDTQQPYAPPQGQILSLDAVRNSVAALPNAQVQRAVLVALDRSNGDLAQAQKNLEDWFNSAMDRVSGWYKRRTQLILFLLGLVAAVVLNLDTFAAFNVVNTNKSIRDGLVAAADVQARITSNGATNNAGTMKTLAEDLQQLNLPMGWKDIRHPLPQTQLSCPKGSMEKVCTTDLGTGALLQMLLGWLITAAAVTLGAPFWFDTLSKFMLVRASVKPDDKPSASTALFPTLNSDIRAAAPPPLPFTPQEWRTGEAQEGVI